MIKSRITRIFVLKEFSGNSNFCVHCLLRVNMYHSLNQIRLLQKVLSYLQTGVLKPDSFSPLLNPFPGQII